MPSLLAEIGFISNQEEERYLNSTRGQDQIAAALFNAFNEYKTEMEGGESETNVTAAKEDNAPVTPVKKDTPVVSKTATASVAKETKPVLLDL